MDAQVVFLFFFLTVIPMVGAVDNCLPIIDTLFGSMLKSYLTYLVHLAYICGFFLLIVQQVGRLIQLLSTRSIYERTYFRSIRSTEHVVVCGRLGQRILQRSVNTSLYSMSSCLTC